MDDRAVGILDNYELEVQKTYKGRGSILVETKEGLRILQEYQAPEGKALMIEQLLETISKESDVCVDEYVRNNQGELLSHDRDGKAYIVKKYYRGRECSPKEESDLKAAIKTLAVIHDKMVMTEEHCSLITPFQPEKEMERHNAELHRVRSFVRRQKPKTDFELMLLHFYDDFESKAQTVYHKMQEEDFQTFYGSIREGRYLSHGDFQYHNVMFSSNQPIVVNFEHCQWDSRVRDIALFLRKTLEKAGWSEALGCSLLKEYESVSPLSCAERKQLYYRLSYPEKFWKIINSYYNSNKAFISLQYMGKLENLLAQEKARESFVEMLLNM